MAKKGMRGKTSWDSKPATPRVIVKQAQGVSPQTWDKPTKRKGKK